MMKRFVKALNACPTMTLEVKNMPQRQNTSTKGIVQIWIPLLDNRLEGDP